MSDKYSQKILDHAKQAAVDALKTSSKKAIKETAEATGDLIGSKISKSFTKVLNNSQRINSDTVTNEHGMNI